MPSIGNRKIFTNWDSLHDVTRVRGFGTKWIAWIDLWFKSAKVKILVNGETTKLYVSKV